MKKDILERVSKIAKIGLNEDELKILEKDANEILKWAEQLKDLEKIKNPDEDFKEVFRPDLVEISNPKEIIDNFPKDRKRFLEVPRSL